MRGDPGVDGAPDEAGSAAAASPRGSAPKPAAKPARKPAAKPVSKQPPAAVQPGAAQGADDAAASRAGVSRNQPTSSSPVDWARVRLLYEAMDVSVAQIRRDFGLTEHELRKRRVAEGWRTRPACLQPGPLQGRNDSTPHRMRLRLARVIDTEIGRLAQRFIGKGDLEQGDARLLTELARAVAHLGQMRDTDRRPVKGGGDTPARDGRPTAKKNNAGPEPTADIAELRAELKRRLARLRAAGQLGGPGGCGDG